MQGAKPRKRGTATKRERQERVVRYPVYHDHSNHSDDWVLQRQVELAVEATTTTGAKKHFPNQLYRMLESVDGTAHSHIVRWLPHGRSFVILDKAQFVLYVLPAYFPSQNALSSFQRQLNSYGFLRLTREEDGYYHELFLRSRPAMAGLIPRSVRSQYSTRRRYEPSSQPDLYAMTWLPDITVPTDSSTDNSESNPVREANADSETATRFQSPQLVRSLPLSSRMPRPVQSQRPQTKDLRTKNASSPSPNSESKAATTETSLTFGEYTESSSKRSGSSLPLNLFSAHDASLGAAGQPQTTSDAHQSPKSLHAGSSATGDAKQIQQVLQLSISNAGDASKEQGLDMGPVLESQHEDQLFECTDTSVAATGVPTDHSERFYLPNSTQRLISIALAATDVPSFQSTFSQNEAFTITEPMQPYQGTSLKPSMRSVHEHVRGPASVTLKSAAIATAASNTKQDPQDAAVEGNDDSESSLEGQREGQLSEWAEFLDDVDLDASSTSSEEKKPRALDT